MITGAPPAPPGWTMGNGNSPPDRKSAFTPLTVVIVGSARIWRTCLFCRSCMVAPRFSFALYSMKLSGFEAVTNPIAVLLADPPSVAVEGYCAVVVAARKLVFPPGLKRLMPN